MNKEECLALLDKIEKEVGTHAWEAQAEEYDHLNHSDLKYYLEDFGLPEGEMDGNVCISLPKNWMEGVDTQSDEYCEVFSEYENVYNLIKEGASSEIAALNWMDDRDQEDLHREYWRLVTGR